MQTEGIEGNAVLSSVANALRVLEHLVRQGEAGISEIARELELTVGTVYRLVSTLVEAGYVEQSSVNRRYRPASKIPELAKLMRPGAEFTAVAHPRLQQLMAESGETTNLGVLRDDMVVYVDRAVTSQPLAVTVSIGSRVPAYCTSLGRAILAYSDDRISGSYLDRFPDLAKGDDYVAPTKAQLERILRRTAVRGFAEDDGEFSPEIACMAAPVINNQGWAAAAVSIAGPNGRIKQRKDDLAPMVQRTAKDLSELLQSMGDNQQL